MQLVLPDDHGVQVDVWLATNDKENLLLKAYCQLFVVAVIEHNLAKGIDAMQIAHYAVERERSVVHSLVSRKRTVIDYLGKHQLSGMLEWVKANLRGPEDTELSFRPISTVPTILYRLRDSLGSTRVEAILALSRQVISEDPTKFTF